MLRGVFGKRGPREEIAEALYRGIVAQARRPDFYRWHGVPDSLDGRFELLVLHCVLVIRRLRQAGPSAEALAQSLFESLFADLDTNLREMGAGDVGVPRRIKAMAQAFYGRLKAYEAALEGGPEDLRAALERNLYGTVSPSHEQLAALTRYVIEAAASLEKCGLDALRRGQPDFGLPPRGSEP